LYAFTALLNLSFVSHSVAGTKIGKSDSVSSLISRSPAFPSLETFGQTISLFAASRRPCNRPKMGEGNANATAAAIWQPRVK
jgi:hypothetical protein